MITSDRGGEYESPFAEICLENGIIHQTIAPYTPHSDGIEERKKLNIKRNIECITYKFRFTTELLRGSYPYSKSNTQ